MELLQSPLHSQNPLFFNLKIFVFRKSSSLHNCSTLHSQLSTLSIRVEFEEWRVELLQSPLHSQNPLFFNLKIFVFRKRVRVYTTAPLSTLNSPHSLKDGTRHFPPCPVKISLNYSFSLRQAIPGRIFPSRNSSDAPPPEIGRASCRERVCQYV